MKTEKLCLNGISNKASAFSIKSAVDTTTGLSIRKTITKFTKIPILKQTTLKITGNAPKRFYCKAKVTMPATMNLNTESTPTSFHATACSDNGTHIAFYYLCFTFVNDIT